MKHRECFPTQSTEMLEPPIGPEELSVEIFKFVQTNTHPPFTEGTTGLAVAATPVEEQLELDFGLPKKPVKRAPKPAGDPTGAAVLAATFTEQQLEACAGLFSEHGTPPPRWIRFLHIIPGPRDDEATDPARKNGLVCVELGYETHGVRYGGVIDEKKQYAKDMEKRVELWREPEPVTYEADAELRKRDPKRFGELVRATTKWMLQEMGFRKVGDSLTQDEFNLLHELAQVK